MLKRKLNKVKYRDVQLNIMPFIDVFSLLNTFLLMSAVFLSIGMIEVQIPFLSSAPPPVRTSENSCDVKVDMTRQKVEVTSTHCKNGDDKKEFSSDKSGWAQLHRYLVAIRLANGETDKVQLFTDDDVIWKDIADVLDAIKLRDPSDPAFAAKSDSVIDRAYATEFVFPKVVMASVML